MIIITHYVVLVIDVNRNILVITLVNSIGRTCISCHGCMACTLWLRHRCLGPVPDGSRSDTIPCRPLPLPRGSATAGFHPSPAAIGTLLPRYFVVHSSGCTRSIGCGRAPEGSQATDHSKRLIQATATNYVLGVGMRLGNTEDAEAVEPPSRPTVTDELAATRLAGQL